ncbi:hypothetical protein ACIBJF_38180 [Streptomyces sp. NPDC050743]
MSVFVQFDGGLLANCSKYFAFNTGGTWQAYRFSAAKVLFGS